jgi:hypothetical protein
VPFLFGTGYGSKGQDAAWLGTPTLDKPVEADKLLSAAQRALGA